MHLGLIVLLAGAFAARQFARESTLTLAAGESASVSVSDTEWELAVWSESGADRRVTAFDLRSLAAGRRLDVPAFDLSTTVRRVFAHCAPTPDGAQLREAPRSVDPTRNIPGLVLEFAMQSALTFSRAGIYYAIASIVAGCILLTRNLRSAIQMSVILGALFLLGYYVVFPRLDEYTGGALLARFEDTRLTGRAEIMDADVKIMEENPILGIGVGQAMSERARFFKGFAAHTEFTRLLSEHGSLGCLAVLLLVIMGIRNVVVARTNRGRAVAASLVAYSFCFMSGNGMRMVLPSFVFGLAAVTLATDSRRTTGGNGFRPMRSARPNKGTRLPITPSQEPSHNPTRA